MTGWDIAIIVFVVIAVVTAVLFFLNRWASRRMVEQHNLIERNKQSVTAYIIDKKKEKIKNAKFPKQVTEQMPKWNRFMKVPLVKAKIGPQILTLMCDKQVFDLLPVKKTVSIDIAGIYIVRMKGQKTKKEMEQLRDSRKSKSGEVSKPASRFSGLLKFFKK